MRCSLAVLIAVAACGAEERPPHSASDDLAHQRATPANDAPARPKKKLSCGERLKPELAKASDARGRLDVLEKSCDAGCVDACDRGATLFSLSFATDSAKDARYFWRDCELGSAAACAFLGDRYKAGRGVEVDPSHALELYERACAAESSLGCSGQARMLEWAPAEAEHVKKLEAHAAELNDARCQQGDQFYCTLLGDAYKDGRGVAKDLRRSLQLYGAACKSGLTLACDREKSLGP